MLISVVVPRTNNFPLTVKSLETPTAPVVGVKVIAVTPSDALISLPPTVTSPATVTSAPENVRAVVPPLD